MAIVFSDFNAGLYKEHLEEASALYDLRRALLAEPHREWQSLGGFEARLEAHLDALVIGGPTALRVCEERMREGDNGELFAGMCVCCRQRDAPLFAAAWKDLDCADSGRVQAVTDALRFEFPVEWTDACSRAIGQSEPSRLRILATAAAARRLSVGTDLVRRLDTEEEVADPALVEAVAALNGDGLETLLWKLTRSPDPEVREQAIVGLLRIGDGRAIEGCFVAAEVEDWPHVALALGGDRRAAGILIRCAEAGRATRRTILALGMLGDLRAIPVLTGALSTAGLEDAAALGLQWVTGASLYETAFVPELVDEDELFEREREAWRDRGVAPSRADGRPYGSEIRRLSRSPEVWTDWYVEHGGNLDPDARYRLGRPYSPGALFDCLLQPEIVELRQHAHQEMVIRYDCQEYYAADALVADQLASLRRLRAWVEEARRRFAPSRGRFFAARA